jgi:hypothetical protein
VASVKEFSRPSRPVVTSLRLLVCARSSDSTGVYESPQRSAHPGCVFRRCEWRFPIDVNTDQHAATLVTAMMPNFIHMVNLQAANES